MFDLIYRTLAKFIFNMMKGEREENAEDREPTILALPAPPEPQPYIPPMDKTIAESIAPFGISLISGEEEQEQKE